LPVRGSLVTGRAVAAVVLVAVVIPAPVIVEGAVVTAPVAAAGRQTVAGAERGVNRVSPWPREPLRETIAALHTGWSCSSSAVILRR
jgi:hypothetical protein